LFAVASYLGGAQQSRTNHTTPTLRDGRRPAKTSASRNRKRRFRAIARSEI